MYEDERKNEIEHVLKRGKEILNEHPEMYEKTYQEVLNILDDGTREMIHNRWGVTARMLAENMNVTNLTDLVDGLAKEVEFCGRKTLTCEYAGYLLQQEYGVDLIELLFLAGEKGVIDRIISFVRPNIYYAKTFRREQVTKLIGLLERHKGEEWGDGILWAYRCFVMKMETYAVVFDEIGEVRCQTEYRLLGLFRGSWYQKNRDSSPRRRNSRRGNLFVALRLTLHYNGQKIRNEVYHHDLWLYRHRQHGWGAGPRPGQGSLSLRCVSQQPHARQGGGPGSRAGGPGGHRCPHRRCL